MPDPTPLIAALLPQSGTPYIVVALAGFGVGIFGHMAGWRWLIGVGIAMICAGALLGPLAVNLTDDAPPRLERPR